MIRLQTYAVFSLLATITSVYYAFSSREQFYPAMVYLSTSKICFVLLLNTGLVAMCVAWQLVKRLFLGTLREAEVERLNEQSWREVVEILFAVTIFRQDFSVSFLAMVAALLLVKALHWLAQKRVEYIETTPSVPMLSHIRIVSFMVFLFVVDCLFLSNSLGSLIQKREASVAIFFSFEYMILATSTVSTFVKYVFYVSDMLMEGQWEKKAVYTFYLELISDLVHLSLYMLFFIAIFLNYGVPLHLIRELYETFRNFRIRISDYVRYRKITSNMNERFPDATPDELDASDATCIICREEMTTAKKLLCGHLFHVHCLRSWLERQHTCPTCRAPIIPPDNGRAASVRQHGAQPGVQPGAGAGTPSSGGAPNENVNLRQAKLCISFQQRKGCIRHRHPFQSHSNILKLETHAICFSACLISVCKAIVALKNGARLLKCGKRGKPKFCTFRLSCDEKLLIWYSKEREKCLSLSTVTNVVLGQKTTNLLRLHWPEKEPHSLSVIYKNGECSLDLICKDKDQAECWHLGLTALVSALYSPLLLVDSTSSRRINSCTNSPPSYIQQRSRLFSVHDTRKFTQVCFGTHA